MPWRRRLEGTFWIALYLAAILAPLAVVLVSEAPTGRDFWLELSVAFGFVGLSMLCLQFALTARFRRVAAPFGIDMILQFHRQVSFLALALLVAHPLVMVIADPTRRAFLLHPLGAPGPVQLGMVALGTLGLLIALSVWRQPLRLSYELWHVGHAVLAVGALGAAVAHVLAVGPYLEMNWKGLLWDGFFLATVLLLVYVRLVKPLSLARRPYTIREVRPERANTWTLVFEPLGHGGLRFRPGQFAWLRLGRSPFALENHPFSFSSSAEHPERPTLTIKALGDFTGTLARLAPGSRAYLDGPYGAFTPDRFPEAKSLVFVAGGVGITPFMSMLETFADRGDGRPLLLIYANRNWEGVIAREAIARWEAQLNLQVVHVLGQPPEGWTGERGFVTADLLARHLGADLREREYFLCGPPPLMNAVERALLDVGVPLARIHMERFNLV